MSEEDLRPRRGLPVGGMWVYHNGSRRHAMPMEENVVGPDGAVMQVVRWRLKDGTDVTDQCVPVPAPAARSPDGQLHMQLPDPLRVIIVTEAEGLNCLENLFYLADTMKQIAGGMELIAGEIKKLRQILEVNPNIQENLRVAKEMEKMKAMGERGG